ncbi:alpha/beta hydrolase [uncultured Oceanicoccus sp.]|uniref:alpha/beta fold hydrolase n=1 Tax=uncultured Oceanicoccus sp. TaxID=1706381 RepID=UPI0030D88E32
MTFLQQLEPWAFTASDNVTLRGWQTRLSGKPIIYFRHGNGLSGLCYKPMLEQLAPHYDLVIMDTQGHGDSDKGDKISWQQCAIHGLEHIEACYSQWNNLWQGAGTIPLYGIGHSFGGIMTLLTAGHRPQLFTRTILLDPVLFPPHIRLINRLIHLFGLSNFNPIVSRTLKRRSRWPSRQNAFETLHGRGIYKGWDNACLRAYTDHCLSEHQQQAQLKCSPTTEALIFAGQTGPIWPSVKKVATPMTIIAGKTSYSFVKAASARAAKQNPLIDRIVIEGRHCFMQERPIETAELILKLLRQA